jgi:ferritin
MPMQDALNAQLAEELASSYLYLAMSAYCESRNLPGFAHWLKTQSDEERGHAMKFYDFVQSRGWRVKLHGLDAPPLDFGSPLQLFEQALAAERQVTNKIHQLYASASEVEDYASQTFLQWFVTEQVEEEKTASDMVETLRMIGNDQSALLTLDRELAGRGARAGLPPAGAG